MRSESSGAPHTWSTPAGLVATGWGLTAAAALWWLLSDRAADQVFVGVLLLVLLVVCTTASLLRPRLQADVEGVSVRRLTGKVHWPWASVEIRVERSRRFGRDVEVLELDGPESEGAAGGLIVLTRLDLGEEPRDVAEKLKALRG